MIHLMEEFEMEKICPKCKSKNTIPILYTWPTVTHGEEAKKGNLILGGCLVSTSDKGGEIDRHCKDCGYEWATTDLMKRK